MIALDTISLSPDIFVVLQAQDSYHGINGFPFCLARAHLFIWHLSPDAFTLFIEQGHAIYTPHGSGDQ